MDTSNRPSPFALIRKVLLPALAFWLAAGAAWAQGDPPGRVADLSWRQGTVVFAGATAEFGRRETARNGRSLSVGA